MATIKFLLETKEQNKVVPVYVRLSINRTTSYRRKTGLMVRTTEWDTRAGLPDAKKTKKDAALKELTTTLTVLSGTVLRQYNDDYAKGNIYLNARWLEKAIDKALNRVEVSNLDNLIPYCRHFMDNLPYRSATGHGNVTDRTKEKYQNIINKLKSFETYQRRKFLIVDVNIKFASDFIRYLREVENISENTAGRYITVVKTIIFDARKNGYSVSHQIEHIKGFTIDPPKVILSLAEIAKVRDTDFESKTLAAARDWLVISCFVGQRVGDLMKLSASLVYEIKGFRMLTIKQEKTGKIVNIPIHPEVEKILAKRGGNFPPVFSEIPDANSVLYNQHLKKVCQSAKIDGMTLGNLRGDDGIYGTGSHPKWMLVTSHIGRRSFATNFYGDARFPTPSLMSVTGHTTEKMFLKYIGKEPIEYGLQLAASWALSGSEK